MRVVLSFSTPLRLAVLAALPLSATAIFDVVTNAWHQMVLSVCHSRVNPFYISLSTPLFMGLGYQSVYEPRRLWNDNIGTVELLGTCIRAAINYDDVRDLLMSLPGRLDSGDAFKVNNLGIIRMDSSVFPCGDGEPTPYSDGYCGIGLGMPTADHQRIRKFLDHAMGSGPEGIALGWTDSGSYWTLAGLQAAATDYLSTRNTLNLGEDAGVFYLMQIHKIVLNIDMTEDEARDLFNYALGTVLPATLLFEVPVIGGILPTDHAAARAGRAPYIAMYEAALSDRLVEYELDAADLSIAAHGLLDAIVFAASPSISGVTAGVVGAYLNDLDPSIDWTSQSDIGAAIYETVRWNPPVVGVPFEEDGIRHHATVGYVGYDESHWGDDADSFRIRGDISYYRSKTLNWADAAMPLDGRPETASFCPARSLSFNLMLAFLEAMDLEMWEAVGDIPKPPRLGAGPGWWGPVSVQRME